MDSPSSAIAATDTKKNFCNSIQLKDLTDLSHFHIPP